MLRFKRPCKCWMPTKALKSKQMKKRKENKRKSRKFLAWALSFNKGIKLEKKEIIMIRIFCPVVFSFPQPHEVSMTSKESSTTTESRYLISSKIKSTA